MIGGNLNFTIIVIFMRRRTSGLLIYIGIQSSLYLPSLENTPVTLTHFEEVREVRERTKIHCSRAGIDGKQDTKVKQI